MLSVVTLRVLITAHAALDTMEMEHHAPVNHIIIIIFIIIIIIIVSIITVFADVLFVHQPGANHAPIVSFTQVNHSVHTLSTFLRIRADPSLQIF